MACQVRDNKIPGLVAEVGVYKGGVLLDLAEIFKDHQVLGYDTFRGMPQEHWISDEYVQPGQFNETSLAEVQQLVMHHPNIRLIAGIFPDTGIEGKYAFVHLDVDFYRSTFLALEWLVPRMQPGGKIVLDDWGWMHCPGVMRAVVELKLRARETTKFQAVVEF